MVFLGELNFATQRNKYKTSMTHAAKTDQPFLQIRRPKVKKTHQVCNINVLSRAQEKRLGLDQEDI